MGVFEAIGAGTHEEVLFGNDPVSGLKTILAIHSTALGPALGGTRFFAYRSEEDALADVLRLSRAMSLKASAAGLDLGGGKAVIIGDPREIKSERLLRAYGRVVDSLGGRYITAEDVGTTADDMEIISRETSWVTGVPVADGGSGDPSPATARGVLAAMHAVAERVFGSDDLSGRTVAVQGVGKVGADLVERLAKEGARTIISDVDADRLDEVSRAHGSEVVGVDDIFEVECDILAPCAMGAAINETTISRLRCRAIVGAANNQLASGRDAIPLYERGILYAPDFVVNAGGVINVSEEIDGYDWKRAATAIDRIHDTTSAVLDTAEDEGITPHEAAIRLAESRIADIGELRRWRRSQGSQR